MIKRQAKAWAVVTAVMLWISAPDAMASSGASCSEATIEGPYGFSITGTNYASDVSWALVGQFSGDGAGVFNGSGTQSVKGRISRVTFTGKYEVKADCSGQAMMSFVGGPSAAIDFVIVADGQEIHLIVADQGTLETGTAKRIRVGAAATKPITPGPAGADR